MKKKVIIVVCLVIVALILFVPIPMRLKDGGSVKYSALLYSVTDVHRMSSAMEGYEEGTIIEVLGLEVYNNVIALETTDDSQEEMKAKLKGERRDNIIASWSGPDRILSNIEKEGIVSARFDSHIPNYIYEVEELTVVGELLSTLVDASYEICDRPKEPWGSIEAIYITTSANEYYLGVIENSAFRVSINGEGEYYNCSKKDAFQNKLLELQGR